MATECVIGVDLGGTKVLAGAVDAKLGVHARAQRSTAGIEPATLVRAIVDAVDEVRRESAADVLGVGFGVPCLMDHRRGQALMAVNLPIQEFPFRDVMAERLGLPVFVDNDANVAALAEHRFGAARGTDYAVVLTIGTGVGGGLILGGQLYRGAIGAGGELGHMTIELDGPRCQGKCPNHGCLEAVASGLALEREARAAAAREPGSALGRSLEIGRDITGRLVVELAHDGDEVAREVVALIGRRLGVGIANYANIFNPEIVVMSGGVMAAGDLILEPAREEFAARALGPLRDHMRIVPARFGAEAGMVGAAALALDETEGRPAQAA